MTLVEINDDVLHSMQTLVRYLFLEEQHNFVEEPSDDHVYAHAQIVNAWLDIIEHDQEVTGDAE